MKTFGTIFSGGELFGIGAVQAGYEHVWGVEYDDKIASVARSNGFNVLTGSVLDLDKWESLPVVDHFHASPPCPNFSVAKTNNGETEMDIQLADAVCWFIRNKARHTVTIENVMLYKRSESFSRIMKTLDELGFFTDVQVLNAADFGVPQTRKRLIVRASKSFIKPYPAPVKWVGWYQAIEDLIPTLPETEFAPWQMARLPEEYKTFLVGGANTSRVQAAPGVGVSFEEEPTRVVATNAGSWRAFIVNTKDPHGKANRFTVRHGETPIYTILASASEGRSKAFIVDGGNSGGNKITIRDYDKPVFTVVTSQDKVSTRAFSEKGRVVKMTTQALGRFQTVPDWYQGLTVKINGNGVPCLMAQKIMETM